MVFKLPMEEGERERGERGERERERERTLLHSKRCLSAAASQKMGHDDQRLAVVLSSSISRVDLSAAFPNLTTQPSKSSFITVRFRPSKARVSVCAAIHQCVHVQVYTLLCSGNVLSLLLSLSLSLSPPPLSRRPTPICIITSVCVSSSSSSYPHIACVCVWPIQRLAKKL